MIWINILDWQHPTHYHGRRATHQGSAASPLQGTASVKAGTARAFAAPQAHWSTINTEE